MNSYLETRRKLLSTLCLPRYFKVTKVLTLLGNTNLDGGPGESTATFFHVLLLNRFSHLKNQNSPIKSMTLLRGYARLFWLRIALIGYGVIPKFCLLTRLPNFN